MKLSEHGDAITKAPLGKPKSFTATSLDGALGGQTCQGHRHPAPWRLWVQGLDRAKIGGRLAVSKSSFRGCSANGGH